MHTQFITRPRTDNRSFVLLLLVLLLLTGAAAHSASAASTPLLEHAPLQTAKAKAGQAAPGTTDPQGAPETHMMFRDDEVFYPTVFDTGSNWQMTYHSDYPDATLAITNSLGSGYEGTSFEVYAKRGRVSRQDRDQVVWVSREDNGSSPDMNVYLVDNEFTFISQFSGLAPRVAGYGDFIGVATGDLDKIADTNGQNHDEVVVAYASPNQSGGYAVNLHAINVTNAGYGSTTCETTVTLSHGITSLNGITPVDNVLDVAIGDFNGDGMNEIAVAQIQDDHTVVVTTFTYHFDGQSTCSLTEQHVTVNDISPDKVLGSLQVDAGDTDGNGMADLVVAFSIQDNTNQAGNGVDLQLFDGSPDLNLPVGNGNVFDVSGVSTLRVQVATGLFIFNPGLGYDFNRRQILLGWNSAADTISTQVLDWDNALHTFAAIGAQANFSPYYTDLRWSIAAGSFKGVLAPTDPRWSAAFYGRNTQQSNPGGSYFLYDVTNPGGAQRHDTSTVQNADSRLPIVAEDDDGNSLFLGAPIHVTAENTLSTDYILYEPPKHVFYNLSTNNNWLPGQIVNLSGDPGYNVSLVKNNTTVIGTSDTQQTDWTVGTSDKGSASATVSEGANFGILKAESEQKFKVQDQFSYNYNHQSKTAGSSYSTKSVTYSTETSADDALGGSIQDLDIWRYRIFGVPASDLNNNAGYYEFVIPSKQVKFIGEPGRVADWYQPQHENENILSYPLVNGQSYEPPDVGTIVISGTTEVISGTLIGSTQQTCCTNGSSIDLRFKKKVSTSNGFTSSHSFSDSLDFSASYSAKADLGGTGVGYKVSGSVGVNGGVSWSNATTSKQQTTVSDDITLNIPPLSSGTDYLFYPVMRTTPDGTYKISYGVQFLPNAQVGFWDQYYGHKPDPALNLPNRFTFSNPTGSNAVWNAQTDDTRKTIRGFYMLDGNVNPITNQNDTLPQKAVSAGAPLKLQVNVYNYSTGGITNQTATDANNLQVLIQYAPFNGSKETGARVNIGTITLPKVSPMQIVPALIDWNTTGLGGTGACATQQYRIIVTLDPNNKIDEIYEAENPNQDYPVITLDANNKPVKKTLHGIDPGQNNQGYAYVTVQNPGSSCDLGFETDALLKPNKSLGAQDAITKKIKTGSVTALRGVPLRVRLKVFSNTEHNLYGHVLLYDGKPGKNNPPIADKLVHFGNPKGATVWFDWVPLTKGAHTLYARLVQKRGDPVKNNASATLQVNVLPYR